MEGRTLAIATYNTKLDDDFQIAVGDPEERKKIEAGMPQVVVEMSRKRLGCACVVGADGRMQGLITDGDLRRLLERDADPLARSAAEVMTRGPVTISEHALAGAALRIMEERKITAIPVVDDTGILLGVIQIHDLWRTELF